MTRHEGLLAIHNQTPMTPNDRRTVTQGLAAIAISLVGMRLTEDDAKATLVNRMLELGVADPSILRDAADEIPRFPQPIDESPEEIARRQPVRKMVGVPSADQELTDALVAREWLQQLADDLDSGR